VRIFVGCGQSAVPAPELSVPVRCSHDESPRSHLAPHLPGLRPEMVSQGTVHVLAE